MQLYSPEIKKFSQELPCLKINNFLIFQEIKLSVPKVKRFSQGNFPSSKN